VNLSYASFSLRDPRDLQFAIHALLGTSHETEPDACRAVTAQLPPSPTVADLVEAVFAHRGHKEESGRGRERAISLLAAYFAMDPPVDPDPF